ncbi:dUTP diphosphatase [Bacillus sp. FSL K6-3431]|uniref:dUTP diphosphatase n=1 Tax=Bacillus sp. FSL K6-3431 TaxID=2921500 RepID=UPI0030F9D045
MLEITLLEEYVDCLHFFLSVGIEIDYQDVELYAIDTSKDVTTEFNLIIANVSGIWLSTNYSQEIHQMKEDYRKAFSIFLALGELLGFSFVQIEQAYISKMKSIMLDNRRDIDERINDMLQMWTVTKGR